MRHLAFAFAFFSCAQIAAGQEQETSRENQPTPALEPVTWERLLNAADEPENWLMYSGTPTASASAVWTRSTNKTSS